MGSANIYLKKMFPENSHEALTYKSKYFLGGFFREDRTIAPYAIFVFYNIFILFKIFKKKDVKSVVNSIKQIAPTSHPMVRSKDLGAV